MSEIPSDRPPPAEPLRESGPPAEPRLAATVILLRRGGRHSDRGLQVCMVRRNPEARFMPNVWVFPGGAVERGEDDGEAGHRSAALRELEEEAGISLSEPDELVPYSRWITPEAVSTRFDTRFYLALAPAHSPPTPDGEETVEARWFKPAEALDLHRNGEIELVFPTIKHLESLLEFATAEDALAAARSREVHPVMPKVVVEGDRPRVVLPGEPGYE
jgi:8-oxo-dGTP pyrophosphatase MutT (NUDIX family)